MAREARKISGTGMYYIVLRGERLFRDNDDEKKFMEMLGNYFEGGEVYAAALSDKEIRLVAKEAPKGISMTMKPLVISYARYYNKKYDLTGKLFAGRFKSEPIESETEKQEYIKSLNSPETPKPKRDTKKQAAKKAAKPKRDTKTNEKTADSAGDTKPKRKEKNSMPSYLL